MTATEIRNPAKKEMSFRPVFINGIMQPTMRKLTAPHDVRISGTWLRLPAGAVVIILGGGANGMHGQLGCDVEFAGSDGQTYRATTGMDLLVPSVS